jgi:hypothetical protein
VKATVDRIEGKTAVLITREDVPVVFNLPASFLGDAWEGDIVDIAITRDPESTKATRERVSSLIEKLKQKSSHE